MSSGDLVGHVRGPAVSHHPVELGPDAVGAVPAAAGGGLGVFGRAGFEEVGVLDAGQQHLQPGQRVLLDPEHLGQLQLAQPPVGDEADIGLDVGRGHALDRAHLEGQVDEPVLQPDHGLAAVDDVVGDGLGHAAGLLAEHVVELDDPLAVQALVAHAPRDDLAHALHLVEAREVHQHGEGGEQLQPLGEAAEHGQGAGDVGVGLDAEGVHVVVLGPHRLVFEEGAELVSGMPMVSSSSA